MVDIAKINGIAVADIAKYNGVDAADIGSVLGATWPAGEFITTWAIEDIDKSITLPLRTGFTYDMTVNWGDGNTSEVTAFDDADITHNYASAGTKTVTITGICQAWYFNNGGDKLKFRTVENWGDVGFTGDGLANAFHGCSNATSFGATMPYYAVTSLSSTWYGCSSAESFPDVSALTLVSTLVYAWYNCSSAESFPDVSALTLVDNLSNTWRGCSSALSFPAVSALTLVNVLSTTWRDCSSALSFPAVSALTLVNTISAAWYNCSSATSFPDVGALTGITSMRYAWFNCSSCTTVPVLPSGSTTLTEVIGAFQNIGAGMGGTVEDLWNITDFPNITSYTDCFTGATGLTNYASIPNAWKGL